MARPAEVEVVQLHWWAMYFSLAERRSPVLMKKLEGNLGGEDGWGSSDDGSLDIVGVSEGVD